MSCSCLLRPMRSAQISRTAIRSLSSSAIRPAPSAAAPASKSATPVSSCPAGTKFTGLNHKKDGTDPVALEDSEYPAWLWTILEPKKGTSELEKELRAMKKAGRSAIKASNTLKG